MMKTYTLLLLFFLPVLAQATPIYKHVDAQGNVTYSDQPENEQDQPVDLKPVSVIPGRKETAAPQPYNTEQSSEPVKEKPMKFKLEWKTPQPEQTFRNTGGELKVDLKLEPALPSGYKLELWLDGKFKAEWQGAPVMLNEVWRGQHVLEAKIVNAEGKTLSSSQVVFYMHQTSLLMPNQMGNGG